MTAIDIRRQANIKIKSAERYTYVKDLGIIGTYFNPQKYKTKRENYEIFIEKIRKSNLNHIIIECAFGEDKFELPPSRNVIHITARDIMWQKERLINHAIKFLPQSCKKVVWIDCDILFENPDWTIDTSIALDYYKIIQPFDFAIRLPKNSLEFEGVGDWYAGFGNMYKNYANIVIASEFAKHGHTGFVWAARRNLLEKHGLYDACIGGSGDHIMAHAFCGDWETDCIRRILGYNHAYYHHYVDWCKSIYKEVRGKVSYIPGAILHLWHGELINRKYMERERNLQLLNFNPNKDIKLGENGAWEWATRNQDLREFASNYFAVRKEDG